MQYAEHLSFWARIDIFFLEKDAYSENMLINRYAY